jgi:hypothetical protein
MSIATAPLAGTVMLALPELSTVTVVAVHAPEDTVPEMTSQ